MTQLGLLKRSMLKGVPFGTVLLPGMVMMRLTTILLMILYAFNRFGGANLRYGVINFDKTQAGLK